MILLHLFIYLYFAISTQVLKFSEIVTPLYLADRTFSMDGAYTDYCMLDYTALPGAFTTCCNSIINERYLPAGSLRTCWIFSFRRPSSCARTYNGTAISNSKKDYETY